MIGLVQVRWQGCRYKAPPSGYRSDADHVARKERRQWRVRRLRRIGFAFSKLRFPAYRPTILKMRTLHINLRNRGFDIAQIGGRQLDARAARYSQSTGLGVGDFLEGP